jgi:hopanoid biosynthesis associated protein HpnK
VTADDFGLAVGVNEAVEQAARDGILTSASLMVAGPEAGDAVARARRLGDRLKVGLHLVVVEGESSLGRPALSALVDASGRFPSDQLRLGVSYGFSRTARRQLRAEIRAQFEAFRATGLQLDHANAHKHMHLHPYVGSQMIAIGREFGLPAIRVPAEPPGRHATLGDRALFRWTGLLRRQAARAGLRTTDRVLGLARTGHMTHAVLQAMVDGLPPGLTEIYLHPATAKNATLAAAMPDYEHEAELAALLRTRLPPDIRLTSYSEAFAG